MSTLSFIDWVFLVLFCFWAMCTLLVHFHKIRPYIRNRDYLSLVPEWKFFAPRPGEHDFHLLYRDMDEEGKASSWHEVKIGNDRRWWNGMWNPSKRGNKALFDVVVDLSTHISKREENLAMSIPYILLLMHISAEKRLLKPNLTQFMILRRKISSRSEESEILYLSSFHEIE